MEMGIYPEFCDGNVVMFYLSPLTKKKHFDKLKKALEKLFIKYPYSAIEEDKSIHTPFIFEENTQTEWVDLEKAEGKICASDCGLFPPCTPFIRRGELVCGEKITLLKKAANTYGLADGKMLVVRCAGVENNKKKGE